MKNKNPLQKRIQSEAIKSLISNFLGNEHFSWIALGIAVSLALLSGWVTAGISNLLLPHGDKVQGLWQLALSIVIFAAIGFYLNRKIEKSEKIRVNVDDPPAAKILVLFLSHIKRKEQVAELVDRVAGGEVLTMADVAGISWEMPLLAIGHHKTRLEEVVVICSQGADGSHEQFESFRNVVASIFPQSRFTARELTAPDLDFEDILAVHDLLDRWYEERKEKADLQPRDLVVDLTGGQKPASIAAALVTLSDGRRFQYISTNNKKVKTYDLVITG